MLRHFGSVPSATIHPRARLLSSVLGVAWAATSCGAPELSTGKSSVANASGELRELLSSEIIGTLTVGGPAVTVNYKNPPRYRALALNLLANQQVTINAKAKAASPNADSVLWITDSESTTLKWNDDAAEGVLDSEIAFTAPADGTYYAVVRDLSLKTVSFELSASGKTGTLPCDPEADADCAPAPIAVTQVLLGENSGCALRSDGTLWCFGQNEYGQLGVGSATAQSLVPMQVNADTDWSTLAVGLEHVCATKTDETLWCWGRNQEGQLGDGTLTNRFFPTQIGANVAWMTGNSKTLSSNFKSTCALDTNKNRWCWGRNEGGQLGVGDWNAVHTIPTKMPSDGTGDWPQGLEAWDEVSQGAGFGCGIRAGKVYCWGSNLRGQLGGSPAVGDSNVPKAMQMDGMAHWSNLNAMSMSACALKPRYNGTDDKAMWCWGDNSYQQLGIASPNRVPTPVSPAGDSMSFAETSDSNGIGRCEVTTTGNIVCWGIVPGTAPSTVRSPPTFIGSESDWKSVTQYNSACAIKNNGSLWCWGWNVSYGLWDSPVGTGRIGLGNLTKVDEPTQVMFP